MDYPKYIVSNQKEEPISIQRVKSSFLETSLAGPNENDNFDTPPSTVLLAKNDSDVMFCLQSYKGLRIHRSLVY